MIIDSHAHIFQHWAEACGHPSREIHRAFMQKVQTRPAAKVFRVRDGKEVTGALLYREDDNSWAGLTDVAFRVGRYGQLDFTSTATTTTSSTCRSACRRSWHRRS